ncbi:3'-phosphoadenosine 5'-phosphosulfate sulfotransferase [Zavarzinia sp.]|uniref:3'-phosphoadenosine 5'-phosphosulfate sulfotransferase n=1 Tax=Zavarzinia sp. TaxID=2027920 RepID=UPI003BB5D898
MLHEILRAHGGRLPPDVHVNFQNTGLEHPETYRFVERVGRVWDVYIQWLEWRPGDIGFEEVGPNNADREGKWFAELIRAKQTLPNPAMRFCTGALKVRTSQAWMRSLGHEDYTSVIGLRADEPKRLARGRASNNAARGPDEQTWPLAAAGVNKAAVLQFWRRQPFDLELPSESFGNCQLCHLKGRARILEVLIADPSAANWHIAQEREVMARRATRAAPSVIGPLFDGQAGEGRHRPIRFRFDGWTYAELAAYCRDYPQAAAREVAAHYDALARGEDQGDLLDSCMCGVG